MLALAGNEITVICKPDISPERMRQIQTQGLELAGTKNGIVIKLASKFQNVTNMPKKLPEKSQDYVFIVTKSYDIDELVLKNAVRLCAKNGAVAIIQNGIPFYFKPPTTDPKGLMSILGEVPLLGLFPVIACHIERAGHPSKITRDLDKITATVGRITPGHQLLALKLESILNAAGIKISPTTKSAHQLVLEKEQFALAVNAPSALFNLPIDRIHSGPEFQSFIHYCIDFVNQLGVEHQLGFIRSLENFLRLQVSKNHFSSMHADVQQDKKTEIDSIIGLPIKLLLNSGFNIRPMELFYELMQKYIQTKCVNKKKWEELISEINDYIYAKQAPAQLRSRM